MKTSKKKLNTTKKQWRNLFVKTAIKLAKINIIVTKLIKLKSAAFAKLSDVVMSIVAIYVRKTTVWVHLIIDATWRGAPHISKLILTKYIILGVVSYFVKEIKIYVGRKKNKSLL